MVGPASLVCYGHAVTYEHRREPDPRGAGTRLPAPHPEPHGHRLDTPGFLASQSEGLPLIDSGPVTLDAREVKTSEEVDKQVKGFRMHPSAFIFGEQLSIDA